MSDEIMEHIMKAKQLGLDLNSLDLEALDDAVRSGTDLATSTGVADAAVTTAAEVEEVYGDNAYLAYEVPKTGNKELDHARLQNAINNQGGGINDLVKGAASAAVESQSLLGSQEAAAPAPEPTSEVPAEAEQQAVEIK